jgi:hypothetical protein
LAFIPYQAKAALERARASPAVKRFGAAVVDLLTLTGKRTADVTDGQGLWFLEARHVSWTSLVTPAECERDCARGRDGCREIVHGFIVDEKGRLEDCIRKSPMYSNASLSGRMIS